MQAQAQPQRQAWPQLEPAPAVGGDRLGAQWDAALQAQRAASARTVAFVIYGLQILAFLYFIPAIVALIVAYVKRGDARGTWVHSHFEWQISTFWLGFLWVLAIALWLGLVVLRLDEFGFGAAGMYVLALGGTAWYLWRVIRGALALHDGRPIA